jgi:hypothetical protein
MYQKISDQHGVGLIRGVNMIVKQDFCDVNFWFAVGDAGLSAEDISRLIVEVPKTPRIISIVVESEGKKFVFTNFGSHIDCLVEGVMIKKLYRLLK